MENKLLEKMKYIYFLAVAVMMYYFLNEYIDVGVHVTHRHVFALVLVFSVVLLFLCKPNIARGATIVQDACVYSVPLMAVTVVSLFIWFVGLVDTSVMARGLSGSFVYCNMLSSALAAGTMLYVFGKRGIWYNLIAILAANLLTIVLVIAEYGLGNYVSEFITLIVTFAGETGDIIIKAELHELAFCLGAYLIYMLYKPKKNAVFYVLLVLVLFCFLSAFKRIAMVAIAIALVLGFILKFIARFSKKTASGLAFFFSGALILVLIGYVAIIKMGAFSILEEMGVETSGRAEVYKVVDEFYSFHPGFLGNGMGFLTYQLNTNMSVGVAAVHNDFLQYYIDLGFWGYIIWLISLTLIRLWYFGRKGKTDNAIITFMLTVYLIVISSTDNTMSYPLLASVLAILMMGDSFGENVRHTEKKIFGSVSPENAEEESESLL